MRILLCDDAAEMRALLRSALEERPDVVIVGEAADAEHAIALARQSQPDVVVLDLDMPGSTPAALLAALRRAAPAGALVTFSGHEPAAVAGDAVRELALHVPKTTELAAVVDAVCSVGRERGPT